MDFNAFPGDGRWFKGNLHAHTTISDGKYTPDELIEVYRSNGYNFLALTDHTVYRYHEGLTTPDFLILPGAEPKTICPTQEPSQQFYRHYHFLALRDEDTVFDQVENPIADGEIIEPQQTDDEYFHVDAQERIDELIARGNLITISHPVWSHLQMEDVEALQNFFAIEIYNGHAAVVESYDTGEGVLFWDRLLRAGRHVWGIAVDDAHERQANAKPYSKGSPDCSLWDCCHGWIQVWAAKLTINEIIRALKAGKFYSSTGPEIYGLKVKDNVLHIDCSPARSVEFVTYDRRGGTTQSGRGPLLTEADHILNGDETYVRVVVVDEKGYKAWSNPIFVSELMETKG